MKNTLTIFFLFLIGTISAIKAQQKEVISNDMLCDVEMSKLTRPKFEKKYQHFIQDNQQLKSNSTIIKIPIVLHSHSDDGQMEIYDSTEFRDLFRRVSDRFRQKHATAKSYSNPNYGADTEIEFHLAVTDPEGNYTSGFVSHGNCEKIISENSINLNTNWDVARYINIHHLPELQRAIGVGGPGTVIVQRLDVGLLCHELGHALSLGHTYRECSNDDCTTDGDSICDTPPKSKVGFTLGEGTGSYCDNPGNSCSSDEDDLSHNNPYRPISLGGLGDQPDMLENYMDATSTCWDSWTLGQKARMRFFIEEEKPGYFNSETLISPRSINSHDIAIKSVDIQRGDVHDPNLSLAVTVKNIGATAISSFKIEIQLNGTSLFIQDNNVALNLNDEAEITINNNVILFQENNSIKVILSEPNGSLDQGSYNNNSCLPVLWIAGKSQREVNYGCTPINPNTINGPGNITTVILEGDFPTPSIETQSITFKITAAGYFRNGRAMRITGEGDQVLGVTPQGPISCDYSNSQEYSVTIDTYNQWISDGQIELQFDPLSNNINLNSCSGLFANRICVELIVPQDVAIECKEVVNIHMNSSEAITIAPEDVIDPNIEITGNEQFELSQSVFSCDDMEAFQNPNVHGLQLEDDQYLEVGPINFSHENQGIKSDSVLTIEFYIATPSTGISEGEVIFSRSSLGNLGAIVIQRGFGPQFSSSTLVQFDGRLMLEVAAWRPSAAATLISLVYDGTQESNSDRLNMYINGELAPYQYYFNEIPKVLEFSNDPFLAGTRVNTVGNESSTATMYYDEIKIWQKARTQEEIRADFKKCNSIHIDKSLLIYLPLSDGINSGNTTNLGTSPINARVIGDDLTNLSSTNISSRLDMICNPYYAKNIELTKTIGDQSSTCVSEIRMADYQGICCSVDTNIVAVMDTTYSFYKAKDLIISNVEVVDEITYSAPEIQLIESLEVDNGEVLNAIISDCIIECKDGIKNGSESEVDCGGPSCEPCFNELSDLAITEFRVDTGHVWVTVQNIGGHDLILPNQDVVIDFWWTNDTTTQILGSRYAAIINDYKNTFQGGESITLDFGGLSKNPAYDYLRAFLDKRNHMKDLNVKNNFATTKFKK